LLLCQFRSEGGADGEFRIREIREIRGSISLVAAGRAAGFVSATAPAQTGIDRGSKEEVIIDCDISG
jgi:hypothetical protein